MFIRIVKQIPNLLTLSNLFLGCLAIMEVFSQRTHIASVLIFAAAIIDFFDGFAARALKAESKLGLELDSLADTVTFGVAPGMILYKLLAWGYSLKSNAFDTPNYYFYPAFLISCFAAFRLAKFNITEGKNDRFLGLPVPAMALFIACLPLIILWSNAPKLTPYILNVNVLYGLIVIMCLAMNSRMQLFKLSPKAMDFKKNLMRWVLLLISILSILFLKWLAALIILPLYFISSYIEFQFLNKESS